MAGEAADVEAVALDCGGEREQRRLEPLLVGDASGGECRLEITQDAQIVAGDLQPTVRSVDFPAAVDVPAQELSS